MTLPNRDGYTPGEKRRPRPSAAASSGSSSRAIGATSSDSSSTAASASSRALQASVFAEPVDAEPSVDPEELRALVDAIAPHRAEDPLPALAGGFAGAEGLAHCKRLAIAALRRLKADPVFMANDGLTELLSLSSLLDGEKEDPSAIDIDELQEVVEQLPEPRRGVADLDVDIGLCADSLSGLLLGESGAFAADIERTERLLREWGTRQVSLLTERLPTSPEPSSKMYSDSTGLSPMLAAYGLDLSGTYGPPKRRANLTKTTKEVLRVWFEEHVHHPYPTEGEKEWLAKEGGITVEQVNNWFINTRGRKWKPMLKRLMAEKQNGGCRLLDEMVQRITEPYERDLE